MRLPRVALSLAAALCLAQGAAAERPGDAAHATEHDLNPAILALKGDRAYGAYLASECTTCHRADGTNAGIPAITLWPERRFVVAMQAYKTGKRRHPVMNLIAGRLGDEEIAALAAFFAAPPP